MCLRLDAASIAVPPGDRPARRASSAAGWARGFYDPRPMIEQRIQQQFFESADLLYQAAEQLARPLAMAAQMVV